MDQIRNSLDARKGHFASRRGSQPPEEQPPAGHERISPFDLENPPPPAPPTPPDPPNRRPPRPLSPPRQDSPSPSPEDPSEDKARSHGEGLDVEVDKELIQMRQKVQAYVKDQTIERQYVLASLDAILPEIVEEYDAFFDPERRRKRLMEAQQVERDLKAAGDDGAYSMRRDAKQKFLLDMGIELGELRKKEEEWIAKVIAPFASFQDSAVDPVDRLLNQYQLPSFLKKALWVSRGGSQPEYSEDGFSQDGVPNYTRILVKLNKLVLHPGFRGRKASTNDYEPELNSDELSHGPTYNGCPVDWGTWWCKIGGYDPLKPDECDKNGWTALHHACDSGFSKRAFLAAQEILAGRNFRDDKMCERMQRALMLKTVGSQPPGFTALHFACDGANRCGDNQRLVHALLQRKADIEAKDARGNTPFLKAAGQGLTDVCEYLICCKADVNATDNKGVGAAQKTERGQKALFKVLYYDHNCPWTEGERGPKQWNEGGYSASRALRYEFGAAHPACPYGKGGEVDVQHDYRAWKSNQRLAATETEHKGQGRGDRRWSWGEGWYERQWGEQHPHGHASKGSSSSNSWNQSAHDSSRWGN